jgi:hypothetical protein
MIRTAASMTGLLAVFALVVYLAYGSGNGRDPAATPAPSAVVAASLAARPQVTAPPHRPGATPAYVTVQEARSVRVVGLEGSCLNIHRQANFDAAIVACVENGTRLRVFIMSDEWTSVFTPDGQYGFAATDFLEY